MNLSEYQVIRKNSDGKNLKASFGRPTTLAQCSDVLIDVILPALEQLLHNEQIAQKKILSLEKQIKDLETIGYGRV
jgi:hypothetical protein